MAKIDWYRQTKWSASAREEFYRRLNRCRTEYNKAQYLRIQAYTLAESGAFKDALELADDMLLNHPDPSQVALAHLVRATCFSGLQLVADANAEFRLVCDLDRESRSIQTGSGLQFAEFVLQTDRRVLRTSFHMRHSMVASPWSTIPQGCLSIHLLAGSSGLDSAMT